MASESFTLKIVTPRGLEREVQATAVALPGARGEIGVLPGHVKYNGLLGVGIMSITDTAGATTHLVVTGGFCTFTDETMNVLADAVDTLDSVDRQSYGKDREALQEQLKGGGESDPQWILAQEKLARLEAIDRLLSMNAH
jgi:ATP synthase F1 epsilon subunit